MILDTGSCFTCLPRFFVEVLAHKRHNNPEDPTPGMGSNISRFLHKTQLGLLDATDKHQRKIIWTSPHESISFINELPPDRGILGMDVMSQWKEFTIIPSATGKGGEIRIIIA